MKQFLALLKDESGATLVEYGLIVAIISVAAIISTGLAGVQISGSFSRIASTLTSSNR